MRHPGSTPPQPAARPKPEAPQAGPDLALPLGTDALESVRLEVLENGLSVLLCETRLAPVAELQIWADVGSADEGPGESGLAHFHEHMLFKGTRRRGVGDVAAEVEGAGGRINAWTSFDTTVYHATLPSDQLAVGIDVLSDAVLHSVFDPEEIAREIEVVLEEIRRSEDSPLHVLGNAVLAEAYRVHPYRAPILGSMESVASFDRARVRAFFERWYTPEHLSVVAVGDFEADDVLANVRAAFGDRVRGSARRDRPHEPPAAGLRHTLLARPFERTNLDLSWPGVPLAHPDGAYLDLLAFLLGSGDSSRLVRRVKEREGLADRIDASSWTPLDAGLSSVGIETDAERAPAALAAAVREVERLRAEAVPVEELEKARANFLASEQFERESVSGTGYKIGTFHVTTGDWRDEARYLDRIRRATPDDLQRAAVAWLAPERLTVGALLPDADAGALDAPHIAACVERGVASTARAFAMPARAPARPALLARPGPPAPPIEGYRLPNGVSLHVLPRRGVPVVAARAAFLGALLAEDASTAGLTSFLTSMWMRGTRGRSAADFARATESIAVEIDGFTGRSSFGLTLETPADRLERALDLVCEVLLEPAFDREEIEHERRETLAAIERREDRLAQRTFLLFMETLWREHPYRRPILGWRESVSQFDRNALVAHHGRLVHPENLAIAVSGDVDPDDVARRLSSRLSDLEGDGFDEPSPALEPPPREIRIAELRKERAQAHLVIGFPGVSVRDDDRFALEVISQILAGQGGRLFLELRDRRGLAYSVNASSVEAYQPGYFATYIGTAPEKLDEAREGLLAELRGLLEGPPEATELERARRYLAGSFAIDQQRNAAHAAHIAIDARYGLGPECYREYPERIAAVSGEDVLRVARRILDLDAYALAVIRP